VCVCVCACEYMYIRGLLIQVSFIAIKVECNETKVLFDIWGGFN